MRPRILVADDEKNLRELYQIELDSEGYEVDTAANATEVMSKLESAEYDLIVLDIKMPGMSGIDLLQKIMARDKRQPVILNTAYPSYRDNFMTWPAEAYVVKSADTAELKQVIKKVLAKKT
ncbi:response regulator [candidate division KSB1 bacterium]|nr:MAG: response regulator [candidate division KSB1 bacterium]